MIPPQGVRFVGFNDAEGNFQVFQKKRVLKSGEISSYSVGHSYHLSLHSRDAVLIKDIQILSYAWPLLRLKVITGPGVYIRSLARELGEELKVGGYVKELIRTRVGEYRIEDCRTIESLVLSFPRTRESN